MDKAGGMRMVNDHIGGRVLKRSNTSFANISKSDKQVWWFTISPIKFENELHLLLAKKAGLIWLRIKAGDVPNPADVFSPRRNGKPGVDVEICRDDSSARYMHDVRSGGKGYDFRPHVAYEWDEG